MKLGISMEELQERIEKHGDWLRNIEDSECVDFKDLDLSYLCFDNVDLRNANLSGAKLSHSSLIGTNLSGANLSNAKLIGTNLSGANLSYANLTNTNLFSANLDGANLLGAKFDNTVLDNVNLCGAEMDKRYYQIVRLGRYRLTVTYCVDDDKVICGVWTCSLAEFKSNIEKWYGENGTLPDKKCYDEYLAAYKFFEEVRK